MRSVRVWLERPRWINPFVANHRDFNGRAADERFGRLIVTEYG
jgi:hypothetical protein